MFNAVHSVQWFVTSITRITSSMQYACKPPPVWVQWFIPKCLVKWSVPADK